MQDVVIKINNQLQSSTAVEGNILHFFYIFFLSLN